MRIPFLGAVLVLAAVLAPVSAAAEPVVPPAPTTARWSAPVGGELVVTRPFEPPANPYAAGHRGVDLAGPPGSPVLAAGDGVVAFAGMVAGRPLVSIDHADGLRTTYEPVHPSVGAGQAVARGSPVGTLAAGHAGCPSPACLHWGLRRGETYLDPLTLLRPPEVRLLPWAWQDAVAAGPATRPAPASAKPVTLTVALNVARKSPASSTLALVSYSRRLLTEVLQAAPPATGSSGPARPRSRREAACAVRPPDG